MQHSEEAFLAPRFSGGRFNGSLPLSVLEDLSAYEYLLRDVAKYVFLEENQGRKRVPNGFDDAVSLELAKIENGSAVPMIMLAASTESVCYTLKRLCYGKGMAL